MNWRFDRATKHIGCLQQLQVFGNSELFFQIRIDYYLTDFDFCIAVKAYFVKTNIMKVQPSEEVVSVNGKKATPAKKAKVLEKKPATKTKTPKKRQK